ncbi:MAG: transglycosylase SLT domain-containing protein [Bacteroidota bacterium]
MKKGLLFTACLALLLFSFTKNPFAEIPSEETIDKINSKENKAVTLSVENIIDASVFVNDKQLYQEKWHELPQPKFWRKVIRLSPEYCIVNVATNRQILSEIPTNYYMDKTRFARDAFKDSVIIANNLPRNTPIYVTSGKNHYYKFENTLDAIPKAVEIFEQLNVDPWFAQAILLIESPNKLQKSSTGAYGPFQLMRGIARMYGLEVNRYKDDRRYLDKSATAAAKFIKSVCIPETEKILINKRINYTKDQLWFKLLVLHVYHAGAGNVSSAVSIMPPVKNGQEFIKTLWQTESRGFRNASQNYSQIALAALIELDEILKPYQPLELKTIPPVLIGNE